MNDWTTVARTRGYESEQAMLVDMYERKGLSISEIAAELACSTTRINGRLQMYRITTRPRGGANNKKETVDEVLHNNSDPGTGTIRDPE